MLMEGRTTRRTRWPSSSLPPLWMSGRRSRPSPPCCGVNEDATGVIAGPAAAVLRAVQRAGTFTAEDLGESGDPEAPATRRPFFDLPSAAETCLSAPLCRCSRRPTWTWGPGPTVRWRRSGAELSRRESCLGVEKGKLVRVGHAVRVRVVAGDRCVLRVRGLEADQIDTRTFLGATVPVLQKELGPRVHAAVARGAAAALARQAVLEPLGLTKAKIVNRGACEASVAPRARTSCRASPRE